MDFKAAAAITAEHFDRNMAHLPLFTLDVNKKELFKLYLSELRAQNADPIFRTETVHNCNCCKSFISRYSKIVAVDENLNRIYLWDAPVEGTYKEVFKAMRTAVEECNIAHKFVESQIQCEKAKYKTTAKHTRLGFDQTIKHDPDTAKVLEMFNHWYIDLPNEHITTASKYSVTSNSSAAIYRLKKGLSFKEETFLEVMQQGEAKAILDYSMFEASVSNMASLASEYRKATAEGKGIEYIACKSITASSATLNFANSAIGTLLQDLDAGEELEIAIRKFNKKVSPENYKQAKAVVPLRKIAEAKKDLEEKGYMPSILRRPAIESDLKLMEGILYSNVDTLVVFKSYNVFDDLLNNQQPKLNTNSKGKPISIDDFLNNVVKGADTIELLFTEELANNLFYLTYGKHPESKSPFKWDNHFAQTLRGGTARKSTISKLVKAKGGRVNAPFRCSLIWNEEGNDASDLDLWCAETIGTQKEMIGFSSTKSPLSDGQLDLDTQYPDNETAIENIYYTDMPYEGEFLLFVNQYKDRGSKGFKAELAINGIEYSYNYPQPMNTGKDVDIATITIEKGQVSNITHHLEPAKIKIWRLTPGALHSVNLITTSPNHWGGKGFGHKHINFFLPDAIPEELCKPYNIEDLNTELNVHRKALQLVASSLSFNPVPEQLTGVCFNLDRADETPITVKVNNKLYQITPRL